MGDELRARLYKYRSLVGLLPTMRYLFSTWSRPCPFMAYLIEPYPGQVISNQWEQATSFEEYTSKTSSFFQEIYNNETMDPHTACQRDLTTNTFAMRRSMTFPFECPPDDAFGYMIKMPASLFYGTGMRSFVLSFLTANKTTRSQDVKPLQFCQHECLLGMHTMELCIWMDKIKETGVNLTEYMVYGVKVINEASTSIWLEFIYRCTVSIYVCNGLWTNYYAHYRPLLTNLSSLGLSKDYIRYEIVIGDPAYAILSDPIVSFAMVVDIWWSMYYVTFAVMRVSQFQDFAVYINGCLYLSRYVWFAYLGMRTMASVVKWRHWESSFACVDPGFLAILAYIYSGPMVTLLGTTRLVSVYYVLWKIGLPLELHDCGTEAITGTIID
ncbi:hypothetical protein Ae201684_016330 [Aphanomyces euteiches]|uniref:Uncharacterized protein n=1 Tax=Aphanomyces euteiches TaxID=100861 RepID=A0A6G0WCK1_9STRA|nr:hypothetical protein Ae201684_016330 [Aphanomyces euteiches]